PEIGNKYGISGRDWHGGVDAGGGARQTAAPQDRRHSIRPDWRSPKESSAGATPVGSAVRIWKDLGVAGRCRRTRPTCRGGCGGCSGRKDREEKGGSRLIASSVSHGLCALARRMKVAGPTLSSRKSPVGRAPQAL